MCQPFKLTPVDSAIAEVAKIGLAHANFGVVKQIALFVWYGSEVKDFTQFDGPMHADMLFLVERLTYYNVVPQPRKKALLANIRQAGGTFANMQNSQLENSFNRFLPELQPMQSRHFVPPKLT